jgi:putative heme-binding domain-containing protein
VKYVGTDAGKPLTHPHAAEATALRTSGDAAKALALLTSDNPHLRRAAVEVIDLKPSAAAVGDLLAVIAQCPPGDTHLMHAARVALRNCLNSPGGWVAASANAERPGAGAALADAAAGVATKAAAQFLMAQVEAGRAEPRFCEAIGRRGDDAEAAAVVTAALKLPNAVPALTALAQGVQARGGAIPAAAVTRIEQTCEAGLTSDDPNQARQSAELAGSLKLRGAFDALVKLTTRRDRPEPLRAAAYESLLAIDTPKAVPVLAATLNDAGATPSIRVHMASLLAQRNTPPAREAIVKSLETAPAKLAAGVAEALTRTPQGADALLTAVKAGKASPRLLQDRAVAGKLDAIENGKLKPRVAELTKGLPSADANTAKLLRDRTASFQAAKHSVERGKAIFTTNCANCHQLGGAGAKVGPQLDGIGNRGLERLLEDTLDPSRNVDAAFRTTTLTLADGRTISGLLLREEGQTLVMADAMGKDVRVSAADIESRTSSPLSPMPANFDTALKPEDYADLIAYLLEQRAK